MSVYDVVHVAVGPPAVLDEELVKKVSEIIGKNLYETRLRLTGKIPKIIANYDTRQQGESTTKSLRELGLVAILFMDSELRKPWQIFRARNLKFEEQAITFCDRSGQAKRIEAREAFLILNARMQAYTDTTVTKITRKLNITATLLTGGIPVMKKVKKETTVRSVQTESFIRLYVRTSPEPAVQIPQHDFDYSSLGPEMVPSAAANINIAIRKIREAFPGAIFDGSLMEPFGAAMRADMVQDSFESNCKLIYWYHQAVSVLGSSAQPQI